MHELLSHLIFVGQNGGCSVVVNEFLLPFTTSAINIKYLILRCYRIPKRRTEIIYVKDYILTLALDNCFLSLDMGEFVLFNIYLILLPSP